VQGWLHCCVLLSLPLLFSCHPVESVTTTITCAHVVVCCDQDNASYPFLAILPELNREMLAANARIDTPHHWQSRWHQWLYNGRGVSYWTKTHDDGSQSAVYLLGNPIVVWGCGLAVIAACVSIAMGMQVCHCCSM
jgi:dolichyl-phosphate-mannose--protein O-mannosyl transferase